MEPNEGAGAKKDEEDQPDPEGEDAEVCDVRYQLETLTCASVSLHTTYLFVCFKFLSNK